MGRGVARDGMRVGEGLGRVIPQITARIAECRIAECPNGATLGGSTCRTAAVSWLCRVNMPDGTVKGGSVQPGSGASAIGSRPLARNEQEEQYSDRF